jgi:hypothetical protein
MAGEAKLRAIQAIGIRKREEDRNPFKGRE